MTDELKLICPACGAEMTVTGRIPPGVIASAMAETLQQALDSLPSGTDSIAIARIQTVIELLEKHTVKLFEDEQRAV